MDSTSKTSRTPLQLTRKQIVSLDQQRLNIRAANGTALARVQIVRALIDGLQKADVDLSQCQSEEDIRVLLTERLQGSPPA